MRLVAAFLSGMIFCGFVFGNPSIEQKIKCICATVPGEFGIAALHVEQGTEITFNGNNRFPMASTYKIPIALYCLSLVDRGMLCLDDQQELTIYDLRPCSRITRKNLLAKNTVFSTKVLVDMMIEHSDNTASDKILKLVGGGSSVTKWLCEKGVADIDVSRSVFKMCADYNGMTSLVDEQHCTIEQYNDTKNRMSKKNRTQARKKFYTDIQDTATPCAMVHLLQDIYKGSFLTTQSRKILLDAMSKCDWRDFRIKKFLPKKTKLWRKTGAMDDMISDVGIIELPKNKGHFAYAFFTNKALSTMEKREKVFAKVTKVLFDYFCSN